LGAEAAALSLWLAGVGWGLVWREQAVASKAAAVISRTRLIVSSFFADLVTSKAWSALRATSFVSPRDR
jgi:hypothetical protein